MRAYWYEKAGQAAAVMTDGQMPVVAPQPGEVRVKVSHSAINPTDVKRRTLGRELGLFPRIVPNNDGAGVIDEIGAGVPASRIGERVWLFAAQAGRPNGSAAEYVTLPSRLAIRLPDAITLEHGACLGVPAVTAHRGLFADGSIAGQTIMVTGAAGRVGANTVQLAKWAGARVVATVASSAKADAVRALGADLVLDYTKDDQVAAVARFTGGTGVDRIVDTSFSATIALAPELVRANGVIATYASDADANPRIPFQQLMYKNITIRPFSIYGIPAAAQDRAFADIDAALSAGRLTHRIGRRFAFDDMIEAHAAMDAQGVWGCVVVDAP